MAVKTWTTERVTSADINTYLTNSGLVYVTQQTVGSAVASVTISNCFSSTYDNYRIVITDVVGTLGYALIVQLVDSGGTPATTNYGQTGTYLTWTSTTVNGLNGTQWDIGMSATKTSNVFDIYNPFKTQATFGIATTGDDTYLRSWAWKHTTVASYTGLKFIPQTATISGGTITVYGYRKA